MSNYYVKKRFEEYDEKKVEDAYKNIQNLSSVKDLTVFFDMDNTLFVYSTESNDKKSLKEENNPGFFANLPLMENARETVQALKDMGISCKIISAADPGQKREDKITSVKKNSLPFEEADILFVEHGKSKAEILSAMGYDITKSILVDDYCMNLFDWYNNGGLAIKKTFSGKKRNIPQVKDLKELVSFISNLF